MHVPLPRSAVPKIAGADKVFHFLAYFGLAWLGGWHHLSGAKPSRLLVLILWAVVYVVYAGLDEWLQQFVGRTPELGDWIVDVLAVTAATAVLFLTRGGQTGLVR